jgi:hypothetical protein
MTITYEEALGLPNKTNPIQPQIATPSPPDRIDLLLDIITVREQLKTLLDMLETGAIKATKELSVQIYILQQIVYTNKTALDALKETNINLIQNNITQVKHVIELVDPDS